MKTNTLGAMLITGREQNLRFLSKADCKVWLDSEAALYELCSGGLYHMVSLTDFESMQIISEADYGNLRKMLQTNCHKVTIS